MLPPPKLPTRARERVNVNQRVAALRLPELPPRDLERLAAAPHSAPLLPAPHSAPLSLPPPLITPTKFHPDVLRGNERSPADVRAFSSSSAPLLVRGLVSPSRASAPLVLPSLALPCTNGSMPLPPPPPPQPLLPPVSMCASAPAHGASPSPPPVARAAVTTPSSPVAPTAHMTQNEIKKAQNRKSAKRFREAQKQRWKNMADDLLRQKKIIDDLRAQLAAHASSVTHLPAAPTATPAAVVAAAPPPPPSCASVHHAAAHAQSLALDRRAMSIHDLVHAPEAAPCAVPCAAASAAAAAAAAAAASCGGASLSRADVMGSGSTSHLQSEAEASLYAQILSTFSQRKPARGGGGGVSGGASPCASPSSGCGSGGDAATATSSAGAASRLPYACDLGVLTCCFVVVSSNARITAIRRGDASACSTFATDGLEMAEQGEFRKAMQCGSPISVTYHRGGARVNAVMNPIGGTDRVIVAEFAPMQ